MGMNLVSVGCGAKAKGWALILSIWTSNWEEFALQPMLGNRRAKILGSGSRKWVEPGLGKQDPMPCPSLCHLQGTSC